VAAVFGAIGDGLAKAFAPSYEVYGVRKGDRIKPRTQHPLRHEIDRLGAVFGIEEFDVFVHAGLGGDVTLELSDPPSVMVPTYVTELPDAQRVFLLARPLAAIAAGLHPAIKLPPSDVALVLAAAVRRLVPSYEDGAHDHERLLVLQDQLAPSWFGRGKVDEAVQRYYAEPVEALAWSSSVICTATRAAALLAGDLDACVSALRVANAAGDVDPKTFVRDSAVLSDLFRFWASEQASAVRRIAGMI
jgi:hypothetical protein